MERKSTKHNQKQKPNWDWSHIQCYLKTVQANRKSTIWNLSPSIILTNPSCDASGPTVRLYIDTEKSLQYSHELGWNWHKSWNIPNISLRLEIKDQINGDFLLSPRNLYAQIFAVKKNTQNEKADRMTLIDVGIRGQSKMQMIDGQVYFSAIKFSSTTYNNEGINFNLLIVLYINEGQFEKPKILTAVISPPIFVDSRRSARDYQQKKFSSFVEPFGYQNIDKQFIKRQNKTRNQSQIIIKNDPQGFYNYITAPNIRHKVKHPIFLAIKFSNCVKIYYNKKLVQFSKINDLLQNLQTKLLKQNKSKQKQGQNNINIEDKFFLFAISNLNDSLKRKKVIQSIQTMQNQYIGITCCGQELNQLFAPIQNIDQIKKCYKQIYDNLVAICQSYQPQYQEESEDQYDSGDYDQSQKSRQSKKNNKQPTPVRSSQRNRTSIISNNRPPKQQNKNKPQQSNIKKQQIFQSKFSAPVFYNNEEDTNKKKQNNSGFIKPVAYKNPNQNNPIFDTSQLNKAFSSNLAPYQHEQPQPSHPAFLEQHQKNNFKPIQKSNPNMLLNQQGLNQFGNINNNNNFANQMSSLGQNNQRYGSIYENLNYSNLMLSNWLTSVKNNNNSLFGQMSNPSLSQQLLQKSNMQRFLQAEQQQKMLQLGRMPLQSEQQQSIISLIQQIGLYKQLLSQVTYQNQLLSRQITFKQQNNLQGDMNRFNNSNNLGFLGNNPNLNSLGIPSFGGLNGINGLGGLGLGGLGGLGNGFNNFGSAELMNNQMNLNSLLMSQTRNQQQISQKQKQISQGLNNQNISNNPLNNLHTQNLANINSQLTQNNQPLNQNANSLMGQNINQNIAQNIGQNMGQNIGQVGQNISANMGQNAGQSINSQINALNQGMINSGISNLNQGMMNLGMPNQGIMNNGISNQGMPNQGMPNQGMPNQGMPNQGMPNQGIMNSNMPNLNQGMMSPNLQNQLKNVLSGSNLGQGEMLTNANYELIKSMVMQEMKKQAEKEKESKC